MVIAGFVVQSLPDERKAVVASLKNVAGVEVYGDDAAGNIVAVAEAETSEDLEKIVKIMEETDSVMNVGLTYMNMEDEAKKIASGESKPKVFGGRNKKQVPFEET